MRNCLYICILQNEVGRDNGNIDYGFSSLDGNDVVIDNSGQNTSNSIDNQVLS